MLFGSSKGPSVSAGSSVAGCWANSKGKSEGEEDDIDGEKRGLFSSDEEDGVPK